jgi:hypothetical protein
MPLLLTQPQHHFRHQPLRIIARRKLLTHQQLATRSTTNRTNKLRAASLDCTHQTATDITHRCSPRCHAERSS